jgi:hypothetical protein
MSYPPFPAPTSDQTRGTDDQVARYVILKNRVENLHDENRDALRRDEDVVTAMRLAQQFRAPYWAGNVEDLAAVLVVELWYALHGNRKDDES